MFIRLERVVGVRTALYKDSDGWELFCAEYGGVSCVFGGEWSYYVGGIEVEGRWGRGNQGGGEKMEGGWVGVWWGRVSQVERVFWGGKWVRVCEIICF